MSSSASAGTAPADCDEMLNAAPESLLEYSLGITAPRHCAARQFTRNGRAQFAMLDVQTKP